MISKLINLANFLDGEGFVKEANNLDKIIKKLYASDEDSGLNDDSYADIVSSYVESFPNKYEFDIDSAGSSPEITKDES